MDEATSARAALVLLNEGVTNVSALLGGYRAWMSGGGKVVTGDKPK